MINISRTFRSALQAPTQEEWHATTWLSCSLFEMLRRAFVFFKGFLRFSTSFDPSRFSLFIRGYGPRNTLLLVSIVNCSFWSPRWPSQHGWCFDHGNRFLASEGPISYSIWLICQESFVHSPCFLLKQISVSLWPKVCWWLQIVSNLLLFLPVWNDHDADCLLFAQRFVVELYPTKRWLSADWPGGTCCPAAKFVGNWEMCWVPCHWSLEGNSI